ncbi:MAG: glycosyltransferase family 4 protein [Desulfobacteraceae bacterium]|nr:glycosyltransferase family 4 protein [Desulfobacteraceae bacterium]
MKILLATYYFLYPSSNGGATMSRVLAKGLRDAGHDVVISCIDVLVPRNKDYATGLVEQDGFKIFTVRPYDRRPGFVMPLWRMRPDPEMAAVASDILAKEKPDIVYMNACWEIGEFVFEAEKSDIPVVFHVHCFAHLCARQFLMDGMEHICSGPETPNKCFHCLQMKHRSIRRISERFCSFSWGKRLVQWFFDKERASSFFLQEALTEALDFSRQLRDSVDAFVVTSELIADIHGKYGVHRQQINVLPHFLPSDRLKRFPRELQRNENRIRLGFFGRISPEKGFDLLLDVLCKIEASLPLVFDLWIISREADQTAIQTRLEEAGIESLRLQVFKDITGPDLNPALANLDVCIIPSLCYEIGPLTMLEAIAQGVPCIVSDSAGMSSVIQDGVNGRLFNAGSAEALERVLLDLLRQPDTVEKWRHCLPNISDEQNYMTSLKNILQSVLSLQTKTGGL